MPALVDDLQGVASSPAALQAYIADNIEVAYDFFTNRSHSELAASRTKLNRFIRLNRNVILQLDVRNEDNLAFLFLLLQASEELGLIGSFKYLYEHLKSKNINVGQRLDAASLYLIGVRNIEDHISRYETIYDHLQAALETEEDNAEKVLMTMVNYYAQVIHNFGEFNLPKVLELKLKIENSLSGNEFSFLNDPLIQEALSVDLSNFQEAYQQMHHLLDVFLGRGITAQPAPKADFLIEAGTEYCELLAGVAKNFKAIRRISVEKYREVQSDAVFRSLGRGVAVLEDESQLYAYLNSYGNMHYEKLIEALKTLPKIIFEDQTNIVDWGCGQAMASMSYFDYLHSENLVPKVAGITLIEPSEIALKRASLHVKRYSPDSRLHTINMDLDSLSKGSFVDNGANVHLHLFSNILDVELFSLKALMELVESEFKGVNYFVCVSPYINDMRTSRLNVFTNHFSKKAGFRMICQIDNKQGEWKGSWTRVVRVFTVEL